MPSKAKPKIISIVGLTASGKSALAIALAQMFGGEIVGCDSRQVYIGLDLLTAKVTKEEMQIVPHHLIDIIPAGGKMDVFQFQNLAYDAIDEILSRGKLPILIGGTGLYSRSVVQGYEFGMKGEKHTRDAEYAKSSPRYDVLQIALMPPKDEIVPLIRERILTRGVKEMRDEAQAILDSGVSDEWMQQLGLEMFWGVELIRGRVTEEEYKENLATKIVQYAKRQRTWFKKEKNTHFLEDRKTFLAESIFLITKFLKGDK